MTSLMSLSPVIRYINVFLMGQGDWTVLGQDAIHKLFYGDLHLCSFLLMKEKTRANRFGAHLECILSCCISFYLTYQMLVPMCWQYFLKL